MEFAENQWYMSLVEQLREKYRQREVNVARMLKNRNAQEIMARASRIRGALCKQLLDPDLKGPEMECRLVQERSFPGYRVEKRVIAGAGGLQIPTVLYLPDNGQKKHPAVVVTMGHWLRGKAREDNQRLCANLALRGAAAITFDPIFQGERCRYTEKQLEEMFGPISEDMWMVGLHMQAGNLAYLLEKNLAALFTYEAKKVTDYLVSREDIDEERLLAAGQSGGGTQACYLAAADDRIRGVIPVQCLSRLAVTLEGGIGDCEQSFRGISEHEGVEQGDLLWAVLPKKVLHCAGEFDFFDVDGARSIEREMRAVYGVLGREDGYTMEVAQCGHALTRQVREQIYPWVCRQFGLEDPGEEADIQVLSAEELNCLAPEEKTVSPVDVYRAMLEKEKAKRPEEEHRIREKLREKIESAARNVPAPEYSLEKGTGDTLILYVGPEMPKWQVGENHVMTVKPWGMDSAYAKQSMGYDLETCMFNASAVLGQDLCARRVKQILQALSEGLEETGAKKAVLVGREAGCVPVLLAGCICEREVEVSLAGGLESYDALFEKEGYFLGETQMLPGILSIADLPKLRQMVKAKVLEGWL